MFYDFFWEMVVTITNLFHKTPCPPIDVEPTEFEIICTNEEKMEFEAVQVFRD